MHTGHGAFGPFVDSNNYIGLATAIEVADVRIRKPRLSTILVPGPDASEVPHTVLKVQLGSTGEIWIVDTAGSQYGFRDVLVPYDKYIADNSGLVVSTPVRYESTETKDLDFYATVKFMNKTLAQRQDLRAEREARLHFAKFVDKGVSENVLDGSLVEWQDKLDSFVAGLKAHMQEIVI